MHRLPYLILFLWLMASGAGAAQFTYPLTGSIAVLAPSNAQKFLILDLSGEVNIDSSGEVSGQGTLSYTYMSPCQWAAPHPDGGGRDCRADGVNDGSFSISGRVLETLPRSDARTPLERAILAFADAHSSQKAPSVPARLSLTLMPDRQPTESLTFWGLSNGGAATRQTGAAALGMFSSGLFEREIQLVAVNLETDVPVPGDAHIFSRSGTMRQGSMVVRGSARIALTNRDRGGLPDHTPPETYLASWIAGPAGNRDMSATEKQALTEWEDSGNRAIYQRDVSRIEQALASLSGIRSFPPVIDYVFMDLGRMAHALPPLMPPQGNNQTAADNN